MQKDSFSRFYDQRQNINAITLYAFVTDSHNKIKSFAIDFNGFYY